MVLAADVIPLWLSVATGAFMLASVTAAAWSANWTRLRAATERQHVLLGGLVALLGLWLLQLRVVEGVWIHLLGVTSLTLIVGWRFTIAGGTLILLVYLWLRQQPVMALPVSWFFSVFVPATTSRLLAHLLRLRGPRNLFVYMLGAGFGGGLLSVLAVALLAMPTFLVIGQSEWVAGAMDNWPLLLLLMFPEGFINGMLVTAFTVFYPDVVKTFDDDYYLKG